MGVAVGVAFALCVWVWLLHASWRSLKRTRFNLAESRVTIHDMNERLTEIEAPAFVCPFCGKASWNVNDGLNGYCGRCHYWTRGASLELLEELEGRGVIPCRERDSNPH